MHVGIDAANLRSGGGLIHLVELLTAADPARDGFERITVWATRATGDQLPKRDWLRVEEPAELRDGWAGRALWLRRGVTREATRTADVLLVPGGSYLGSFAPVVTIFQNLLPFDGVSAARYGWSAARARIALLARLQRRTLRRSDGIVYLTETARRIIEPHAGGSTAPAAVIPHGISVRFRAEPRTQRPISELSISRPFRLLYVSTIDLYKHQVEVVRAVAALRREGLPLELHLVGSAYAPAARRLAREIKALDADRFVTLSGEWSYENLPAVYEAADAFVFASSCENMPITLLEAMAAGLPIACSKRGVMPEVLGGAGVYFEPEDFGSIVESLRQLITDHRQRAVLAGTAVDRSRPYTWERCASTTFEFVRNVVHRHRNRS